LKFLKADVNPGILALVLFVSISFVTFIVYYQFSINKMQNEYDAKLKDLLEIEKKLLLQEKKLNELYSSKTAIENDKEILENGYLSLQSENSHLKIEKSDLLEDLNSKPFAKALCRATGNVRCLG
jgi:hypothetical protein